MVKKNKRELRGKKKLMFNALKSSLGNVSIASENANVSRDTHYRWLKEDTDYKKWVEETKEVTQDFVEHALLKKIKAGDTASIIFFAKTKMKDRGYIEKQQLEYSGNEKPIPINITIKSIEQIEEDLEKQKNGKRDHSND